MRSYSTCVLYNTSYMKYGNSISIYKSDILKLLYGIIALPIGTSCLIMLIPVLKYVLNNRIIYRY